MDTLSGIAGGVLNLIGDIVFYICFLFDSIVYSFIPMLYKMIITLANIDLSGIETITNLMNRVYILIGVFMLFKLAFSVVQYIIDPDSFSDKTKGFTNLVKRVLIALVLLVLIPWIFERAYDLQGRIIKSNIIPNLILGTEGTASEQLDSSAKDLQFLIYGAFFSVNPIEGSDLEKCDPKNNSSYPLSNVIGTRDMALAPDGNGACLNGLADVIVDNGYEANLLNKYFKTTDSTYEDSRSFSNLSLLLFMTLNGQRIINYIPVVSTIVGGYLVFLLLSFCIDIAARAIKLMFLQILSPIAVIGSIDPKASGDKLKDWGKECLSTFASLFLRLAVIYLIIQIVSVVTSVLFEPNRSNLFYGEYGNNVSGYMMVWIYVFLTLGAFSVAKKLPELIEKAVGIKFSGELNLNPFKGSLGTLTSIGIGAAAGGMAGAVAGAEAGAPLRGVLGGIATGGIKGANTKLSPGTFGDLRRRTYKDMTGNDFRSFNPVSKVYGIGGKEKIGDLNKIIGFGRDELNMKQTKLNSISHVNAERRMRLMSKNIDPSDEQYRTLMEQEANIADLLKQRNEASAIHGQHSQAVIDLNSKISDANNKFVATRNQMGISDSDYKDVRDYLNSVAEENDIRGEIGKIQKNISTLSDQKKQMERFYQVDSSPIQSVNDAIEGIRSLDEKKFDKEIKTDSSKK